MPYGPGGFNHGGGYTQRLAWGRVQEGGFGVGANTVEEEESKMRKKVDKREQQAVFEMPGTSEEIYRQTRKMVLGMGAKTTEEKLKAVLYAGFQDLLLRNSMGQELLSRVSDFALAGRDLLEALNPSGEEV